MTLQHHDVLAHLRARAAARRKAAALPGYKFADRAADTIAANVGSWRFILVQSALLLLWLAANAMGLVRWDPYPFILLNLILSFQAVATADPSLKQALLASGISISMYTTALGLAVAIPSMVFYSFLVSRQNSLVEQLTEKCGKLTELLTGSHVASLAKNNIYPDSVAKGAMESRAKAPPTNHRAS